jgi:hypothetical protein
MAINFKDLILDFGAFTNKDADRNRPKVKASLENIVNIIYKTSEHNSGPWIAGGCGRQVVVNDKMFNDIDVWFQSVFQLEQCRNRLNDAFGYEMYETYNSENATTYQVGDYKVQLIRRAYYPTVNDVFDSFDFTCCQVALDSELQPYGPGVEAARTKQLILNNYDPKAFLARYAKYVGYGYVMDPKEFIAIIEREDINYEFDGSVFGY